MAIFNFSKHIEELNYNIKAYIESNIEYYRLQAFKKATKGVSLLVQGIVVGSLFLFFLTLISIVLSLLIGKAIGQLSMGFLIVGGFYFLLFLIFFIFRKALINSFVLRQFAKVAADDDRLKDIVDQPLEGNFDEDENKKDDESI